MEKVAFLTGVTGMDGSILADMYLAKGYKVYGMIRRTSSGGLGNAAHLENDITFVYGDLSDGAAIAHLVRTIKPDVFINCAAQSHVGLSFEQPEYTMDVTGLGVLRCLEAVKKSGKTNTRFLQLSTSEMFGNSIVDGKMLNEESVFEPASPYAVAKCAGYWTTRHYRMRDNMFAANSICFNHEGPRRGPEFVTRKITLGAVRIWNEIVHTPSGVVPSPKPVKLGNLAAMRDWGDAEDYCKGMIKILEHDEPDDFVLATGETHSVQEFVDATFKQLKLDPKQWVEIDARFYRPLDVDVLIGDASKAKRVLGWEPTTKFHELVKKMVDHDVIHTS